MLTGAKSYTAIAQFGRDKGAALACALGFRRGKTPAKSTLSDALPRASTSPPSRPPCRAGSPPACPQAGQLHVCLDGKTARGSRDGDVPGHHLVAAYAPAAQAVLAQFRVDAKTNEHKAALRTAGHPARCKGSVFTGDAMFCQRDVCGDDHRRRGRLRPDRQGQPAEPGDGHSGRAGVRGAEAAAGGRLPPLRGGAAARPGRWRGAWTRGTAGWRCGRCELTTILTKHQDWTGLKQGFELDARADREGRDDGGGGARDNQPEPSSGPTRGGCWRWCGSTGQIENGSHYRRDVTLGEDASRIRKGSAPQVMAALRNTVIHLAQEVAPTLAAAVRKLGNCFSQALDLLGFPQLE